MTHYSFPLNVRRVWRCSSEWIASSIRLQLLFEYQKNDKDSSLAWKLTQLEGRGGHKLTNIGYKHVCAFEADGCGRLQLLPRVNISQTAAESTVHIDQYFALASHKALLHHY